MQISFFERLKSVRNDLKLSLHSPMVSLKKKSESLMKYYIKVTCAFKRACKLPRKTETYESAKCVPCNTRKCTHNRFVSDLLKWVLKCRFYATGPWAARNVFVKSLLTQWLLSFYYLYYSWCYIVLNSFCKLCTYFLKLNKVIVSIIYNNNNNNNNNNNK